MQKKNQELIDYIDANIMPDFAKELKLQIDVIEDGIAELSIKDNKKLYRKTPITVDGDITFIYSLSGQAVMSIADTSLVYAVIGKIGAVKNMVTVDVNTQFIAPLLTDTIFIKAKVLKLGKTLVRGQVDLLDENNKLCATALVNYMFLD